MLLEIPTELESERLLLRPYQSGDGAWLHTLLQRDRSYLAEALASVHAHFGFDLGRHNDAELFVRHMTADWILRRRFVFGVWEKASMGYVGQIWLECKAWATAFHELGYFVLQAHAGRGIATEAAKLGLTFLFQTLHANKVSLTCDVDNVASYRVAERCGFQQEGRLRNEVQRNNGTRVDKLYYGLLKRDFEMLQSHAKI